MPKSILSVTGTILLYISAALLLLHYHSGGPHRIPELLGGIFCLTLGSGMIICLLNHGEQEDHRQYGSLT